MSDEPGKNPYRPGVGIRPPFLAGREPPLRRFEAMLRAAPELPANMRLTGLRGVGKTVLLKEFEERGQAHGWITASLELSPGHNTDAGVTAVIAGLTDRAMKTVSRIERTKAAVGEVMRVASRVVFTWNDVAISLQPSTSGPQQDLARSLFEVTRTVVEKGFQGLLLLLDEAQVIRDEKSPKGEHPLSLLIATLVALQRQELPLGLVLCGLPTLTGNLLKARSYTERMFRGEEIGSLQTMDAREALIEPLRGGGIEAQPEVVEWVVNEVEGYPYFVQLWGAELWDAAVTSGTRTITQALLSATQVDVYHRLDNDFYEPRVTTLTPAEQDLLLATAHAQTYPPLLVSEINGVSDRTAGNINVLLGRMTDAGVLYRVRKGQYEYTAPKFRNYLQRRMQQKNI